MMIVFFSTQVAAQDSQPSSLRQEKPQLKDDANVGDHDDPSPTFLWTNLMLFGLCLGLVTLAFQHKRKQFHQQCIDRHLSKVQIAQFQRVGQSSPTFLKH